MTTLQVFDIPDGTRGADCNTPLDAAKCSAFRAAGVRVVTRYVRRGLRHDYDLTKAEAVRIMQSGLGLNIVQHVDRKWVPSAFLGAQYGATAAAECRDIGVPAGVTVSLDLEDVRIGTPAQSVIDYCKAWYAQVRGAGFLPMLYVGFNCGLTGAQLYWNLPFARYWGAYNLNADERPAVRGLCAHQGPEKTLAGVRYDPDTYQADAKGGRATCAAQANWLAK